MTTGLLLCPVCRRPLEIEAGAARCPNGHSFDVAREGYVNLLRGVRPGNSMGDDKFSARARRDFLSRGYFQILRDELCRIFRNRDGPVLDICCGEGYYTSALGENPALSVYGFDLSKEMVRLAAKRGRAVYFVANMADIPVRDGAFTYAVHLFAPFQEREFSRILAPGGRLCTVVPGRKHLYGLKEILYAAPYENDEKLPETTQLQLVNTTHVSGKISLETAEDIQAVFRMTPYYFRTAERDKDNLRCVHTLETEIEFVIGEYEK